MQWGSSNIPRRMANCWAWTGIRSHCRWPSSAWRGSGHVFTWCKGHSGYQNSRRGFGWGGSRRHLARSGVSSMQLSAPERGFSFRSDGPLDMRFDSDQELMAVDLVNDLLENDLADLIYAYGEEREIKAGRQGDRQSPTNQRYRRARRCGCRRRPQSISPYSPCKLGPFKPYVLRSMTNWPHLKKPLPQCVDLLRPGGRLAVIAFHSLEDRIVKRFMRNESKGPRG